MQPAFDVHIRLNDTIVLVNRFLLVGWNVAIHNPDPPSARLDSCRRRVMPKFPFPTLLFALQFLYASFCFTLEPSYSIPP